MNWVRAKICKHCKVTTPLFEDVNLTVARGRLKDMKWMEVGPRDYYEEYTQRTLPERP